VVRGLDRPEDYLDRFLQVRVTTAATYQVGAVAVDAAAPRRRAPLRPLAVAEIATR